MMYVCMYDNIYYIYCYIYMHDDKYKTHCQQGNSTTSEIIHSLKHFQMMQTIMLLPVHLMNKPVYVSATTNMLNEGQNSHHPRTAWTLQALLAEMKGLPNYHGAERRP